MLRTGMGPTITGWLEDPAIVEIMVNPDGRLWIDRLIGEAISLRTRMLRTARSQTGSRCSAS